MPQRGAPPIRHICIRPRHNRARGGDNLAFATRALHLTSDAELHVTAANWNGVPTLFVDYQTSGEYPERPIIALQRQSSGGCHAFQVMLGEQEGGAPDLAALGFAHADHGSAAKNLIVVLSWDVKHAGVSGTLYEVRIFTPPQPGASEPNRRSRVSRR